MKVKMQYIHVLVLSALLPAIVSASRDTSSSHRERFLMSTLKLRNTGCKGTYSGRLGEAVCMDKKECLFIGGTNIGTCGLLGACCRVERTCHKSTRLKVSYFVNSQSDIISPCTYQVFTMNQDVCQIRLDFEVFQLAPPTSLISPTISALYRGAAREAYLCRNDSFTVTSPLSGTNNLGFVSLCGSNDGQHIYIPVNATQGADSITLSFNLADRTSGTNTANPAIPTWRIKVTQLECGSSAYDYSTLASTLSALGQQHLHKSLLASSDYYRLAPPGCLQYYTERTGTYMSFNFDGGVSIDDQYIGNLHYAICFRRTPDVCGIRHTAETFQLSFNGTTPQTDTQCVSFGTLDYLLIPEGMTSTGIYADKYCDSALNSFYVTSETPGPLYVVFRSDNIVLTRKLDGERGFRINYEVLSTCT